MGTSARRQPQSKPTWLNLPLVPEEVTRMAIRPPGHGKDGVPLVKQGRQDGEPGQVNYGLYLLWREADVVRNGPVLRAAAIWKAQLSRTARRKSGSEPSRS